MAANLRTIMAANSKALSAAIMFILLALLVWTSFFDVGVSSMGRIPRAHWREIAEAKRISILDSIPNEWRLDSPIIADASRQRTLAGSYMDSLLDEDTRVLTALDSSAIVEQVSKGLVTSVEIIRAFAKRTAIAHQIVRRYAEKPKTQLTDRDTQNGNLLEFFYDLALERAQELDRYFKQYNSTVGPLHGLPVSLKDQFHVKGVETTMAYVGWIGTFEGEKGTNKERHVESELVRELLELGAIPIAKVSIVETAVKSLVDIMTDKPRANIMGMESPTKRVKADY